MSLSLSKSSAEKLLAAVRAEKARRGLAQVEDFTQPETWFHEGQTRSWQSRALEVAIIAGFQSGKTAILPYLLLREIQRCAPLILYLADQKGQPPSGDFLFVGPTLTLMGAQAVPTFKRLFESGLKLGRYVASPKPIFTFSDEGCQKVLGFVAPLKVHIAYANDSSNLESLTALAGAWDEAGQKENIQESYEAFNRRLSIARSKTFGEVQEWIDADEGRQKRFKWWTERFYEIEGPEARFGRRFWGTTPYEWNWFKTLVYDAAADGKDPEWDLINFATWMNPVNGTEEECRKQLATMPAWRWQMMFEGKYTRPAGLVFDCFDEHNLCDPFPIPAHWKRLAGLDFGSNNTAAVPWAQDPDTGEIVQYEEYHPGVNRTYEEHSDGIREKAAAHFLPADGNPVPSRVTPQCSGGNRTTEQGEREAYRKHGLPIDEPNRKHTDPKLQYQCLYELIKTKKLRIFRTCTKTIGQYHTFSYKLDENKQPTDEYEHEGKMHLLATSRYIAVKVNLPIDTTITVTQRITQNAKSIYKSRITSRRSQQREDDEDDW